MPVLVPAVVPLVPSNKANESSLHGAAFPTEPTLCIQASGVHDEAPSRAGRSLVVATPAYQTAYQSVRPGPIKQVLRRTLATLSAAIKRGGILADTEEVTGSNPVSPTVTTPLVSPTFACVLRWDRLTCPPDCVGLSLAVPCTAPVHACPLGFGSSRRFLERGSGSSRRSFR
jgi:hypothetical protein